MASLRDSLLHVQDLSSEVQVLRYRLHELPELEGRPLLRLHFNAFPGLVLDLPENEGQQKEIEIE